MPATVKFHYRAPTHVPPDWLGRQPKALREAASGDPSVSGMLLATCDACILGELCWRDHGDWVELTWLRVRERHRRIGVATALLRLLLSKAPAPPYQLAACEVGEDALGAQQFLRARGFRCWRVEQGPPRRYCFSLQLTPRLLGDCLGGGDRDGE